MPAPLLENVFTRSGLPTYTFVEPTEFPRLVVSLRTAGRPVIVEGPSGIGKTTCVKNALRKEGLDGVAKLLSARKPSDLEIIKRIHISADAGIFIIDDFHILDDEIKRNVADHVKLLADAEIVNRKIILIGINKAGEALFAFAPDLLTRLDRYKLERNPDEKIRELIEKGEHALNIGLTIKNDIIRESHGSFSIAQMMCFEACIADGVTEAQDQFKRLDVSMNVVKGKVLDELSVVIAKVAQRFARGRRVRREGRAPYLHLLHWMSQSPDWTLDVERAAQDHPAQRASVLNIIEQDHLATFISENQQYFGNFVHYDQMTKTLSVEDPKVYYFLKNISWKRFAGECGFIDPFFESRYDFALSFAGQDRGTARLLSNKLIETEVNVFFDEQENHRILATDLEDYFGPIYKSDADFVVAIMGPDYPSRIWTKFESEQFKARFGEGRVIPIWFNDTPPSIFDSAQRIGGIFLDRSKEIEPQVNEAAQRLIGKLREFRQIRPQDADS